jgi:hypothetical protein
MLFRLSIHAIADIILRETRSVDQSLHVTLALLLSLIPVLLLKWQAAKVHGQVQPTLDPLLPKWITRQTQCFYRTFAVL